MRVLEVSSNPRIKRTIIAAIALGTLIFIGACGKNEQKATDFDTFLDRHRCEQLKKGSDGDIDMTCIDPQTGQRVAIQFEANDRPEQYFTEKNFGGVVHVFSQDEVRDSEAYSKIKKG